MSVTSKLDDLREQLLSAAREFAGSERKLDEILAGMAGDVARAAAERLEIFPVCHHSPASALFMAERLIRKRPKVIFMEMCEDMRPVLNNLRQCKLPVALQAFASEPDGFPASWAPLSAVAPLTEFSAEFQIVCYTLDHGDCDLVFVDRSVDHIFQWMPKDEDAPAETPADRPEPRDDEGMHGSAVGLRIGSLRPGFAEFEDALLKNAKVRHYSEWWDRYVEDALLGREYSTYRHLMCLIGSLYRRLQTDEKRLETDCNRERYMWQRMKEYLSRHNVAPEDCIYACGAFHAVSGVEAFGIDSPADYRIPDRTATEWLYGIIPSSYSAIEWQFGLSSGTVSIASASWNKAAKKLKLPTLRLAKKPGKAKALPKKIRAADSDTPFMEFLAKVPDIRKADTNQLIEWSVEIVRLARKNGYLTSTADAISVYEFSVMLANLRGREHPSAYDFQDAAITCLEKEMTPRKRDIRRLCEILLGGDRIGQVGYDSLPPLARDVHQRLKPLNINLQARTIQRALLDFQTDPHLEPCSDLLWKLRYLLDDYAVRPIMGDRRLGVKNRQESWDVAIGKYQRPIIELGYEGVTVEQVFEKRLRKSVFGPDAKTAAALKSVEDSILFLKSRRLTEDLGERAAVLLLNEESAQNAPEIFTRIRTLLHYYRANEPELPVWLKGFVVNGYSHFCTMLPESFADDEDKPRAVSAMLGFVLTLESLALSLGCNREQFMIALEQSKPETPAKKGLLWSVECLLNLKTVSELRTWFDHVLDSPLLLGNMPEYLSGLVLSLEFNPTIGRFIAELLSKTFGKLPDSVLFPWLPNLIMTLRQNGAHLIPKLLKEADMLFPANLAGLDAWTPEWEQSPAPHAAPIETARLDEREQACLDLLATQHETCNAMAALFGIPPVWRDIGLPASSETGNSDDPKTRACRELLEKHPETANAIAQLVGH